MKRINNRHSRTMRWLGLMVVGLMVTACQATRTGYEYAAGEVNRLTEVEEATVISTREVDIQGQSREYGSLVGGVLGGIGASELGGGRGQTAAALVGLTLGALVGDNVERAARTHTGTEYILRLKDGRTVSIVQAGAPIVTQAGAAVKIVRSGINTKIIP